ncbi:hypothetical protein BD779DRAFT_273156 [Infundibulicybe gibba]|nr:hypothetical protein BD779DRAFT_273156 [Infundibulicybe gibba]
MDMMLGPRGIGPPQLIRLCATLCLEHGYLPLNHPSDFCEFPFGLVAALKDSFIFCLVSF